MNYFTFLLELSYMTLDPNSVIEHSENGRFFVYQAISRNDRLHILSGCIVKIFLGEHMVVVFQLAWVRYVMKLDIASILDILKLELWVEGLITCIVFLVQTTFKRL